METNPKEKVEAVLFASGRFMDEKHIAELIGEPVKKVHAALEELQKDYEERTSALRVLDEELAWKLHVRDEHLELISKVISDSEVSGPVLETLAIIAWRSPALQADVVHTRGSNAYEHIKELVERGFVTKEPEGRSYRLRISEKFFDYFDVEGRDDIRKMFKEVEEAHRKKEMEQELAEKRIAEKLKDTQNGEQPAEEQQKLPEATGEVDIDKLDEVLEKSKKAREKFSEEIDELKPKEEPEETDEELSLEDAKKIREAAEEAADELAGEKNEESS